MFILNIQAECRCFFAALPTLGEDAIFESPERGQAPNLFMQQKMWQSIFPAGVHSMLNQGVLCSLITDFCQIIFS